MKKFNFLTQFFLSLAVITTLINIFYYNYFQNMILYNCYDSYNSYMIIGNTNMLLNVIAICFIVMAILCYIKE
jgi:hypothetical protein